MRIREPRQLFGRPFLCDYEILGIPQTVTLYATDWRQLEADFQSVGLEVIGEHLGDIDYDDE